MVERKSKGHLRLFFGMAAGVGKTCAMLKAGHEALKAGKNLCVGFVETHGRVETQKLAEGLPTIPRQKIEYRGTVQEEMNLDAILQKKPELVLVDELAHTNVPGSRHEKRYQDVVEILEVGIDVYSTMNVQHLESRAEIVQLLTATQVREIVPDFVLDMADQIELVDLTTEQLIQRLKAGKVYPGRKIDQALQHFFQEGNLNALREMVLRVTADKVVRDTREVPRKEGGKFPTKEAKLLVAVSPSSASERLVHAARRTADMLQVPWTALYVDTGISISDEEQNQLTKNLKLAEEMGAEVLMYSGTSVPKVISEYAQKHPLAEIIVGRPAPGWRNFFRTPRFFKQLVEANPHVDITILQHPANVDRRKENRFRLPEFHFIHYFHATFWVGVTAFLNHWLNPYIGYRAVGFIFLLMVSALGLYFSLGGILIATILSALLWNYFFIPPTHTLTIQNPEDATLFITYCVIAALSSFFVFRVRRSQKLLKEGEEKMRAFYEILKGMTLTQGIEPLIELGLEKIENLLHVETCVLLAHNERLSKENDFGTLKLESKERMIAAWSLANGKMAGWSTDTLADSKILSLCLKTGDKKFGVLALRPKGEKKFNPEQQDLLFSLANTIAAALAKKQYDEESKQAHLVKESEKLHQTLFHSISHELRTPLTTILGAATTLQSQKEETSEESRQLLLNEIVQASERLNRVFDNLLDLSRIEAGAVKISQEWFDLSEVIKFTIEHKKEALSAHPVLFENPTQPIYFFGDFDLLEHGFSNLLLNAANYSPQGKPITIKLEKIWKEIHIHFEDEGEGIPAEMIPHVFEKFYRLPGTPTGGLGLGLAIVKNVVELHGGRIEVKNNHKGGATFTVILPFQEAPNQIQEPK